MIRFSKVSKSFGKKEVLKNIDLEILPGKILFVLGKSGTGKSVLLKHIVGLMAPDAGEVWVEEKKVSALGEEELFEVRRWCGMVFQQPALLDSFTVYENLALGIRSHRLAETVEAERAKILEKLDLLDLDPALLSKYPPEVSYGVQKRLSLCRSLVLEPRYLLFDEPTTAQDPISTKVINALIVQLSQKVGVTCVVVSHDMPSALSIGERIVVLEEGRVVDDGSPKEVLRSSVPITKAFLQEASA